MHGKLCFFLSLIKLIGSVESFVHRLPSQNGPDLYKRQRFCRRATVVDKTEFIVTKSVDQSNTVGDILFLIPSSECESKLTKFGSSSPVGNPNLLDTVQHLARKCFYFADGLVDTRVVTVPARDSQQYSTIPNDLENADVLIAIGLDAEDDLQFTERLFEARRSRDLQLRRRQCHFALDCSRSLEGLTGLYDPQSPSLSSELFPWTEHASAKRLYEQMSSAFGSWTSDEFCYAVMIFMNRFSGREIDWVKYSIDATWEKGPIRNAKEFYMMVTKCQKCILDCAKDENCRTCLAKLTELDARDQVQSYRTIVSYESDILRDFTLCIMTKNNIFNCNAEIPTIPKVEPMTMWRGEPVTEEIGRSLLVGHLDDPTAPVGSLRLPVSWKVACGANVAYDQFPSQNQLFYPAARGRDMWYDPVFRAIKLDGQHVWCKRHYKVRHGGKGMPATFRFSVLDNGITSSEFWTIVAAADDLSWIVFHYAGAASAVGQRYLGGLLCTPDGSMPSDDELPKIWEYFRTAGIQPWELYRVNNDDSSPDALRAGPPPLDFFRKEVLAKRAAAATEVA